MLVKCQLVKFPFFTFFPNAIYMVSLNLSSIFSYRIKTFPEKEYFTNTINLLLTTYRFHIKENQLLNL